MSLKEVLKNRIEFSLSEYKGEQTSLCLRGCVKYKVDSTIRDFIHDFYLMYDERFFNTQITYDGSDINVQLSDELIDYLETRN